MPLICTMRKITILIWLIAGVLGSACAQAQGKKLDTTVSQNNAGYRVLCNNKNASANDVSIYPKGFDKEVRDMAFTIKGTLRKILIDDFNSDGYPDLVLCIYSGADGEMGTVVAIVSAGRTSLAPADFPDVYSNPALREGYKGHDVFTTLMGSLMQSFPIYKPDDTETATGGTRVVQYTIAKAEQGRLTFKMLRSYEKKN